MKTFRYVFLSFTLTCALMLLTTQQVNAIACNGGCQTQPGSAAATTGFTVSGSGCTSNSTITSVAVYNSASASVFAAPITIDQAAGTFSVNVPAVGTAGVYQIVLTEGGGPPASCGSFTAENVAGSNLKCGDVTASVSNLCPTNCPSSLLTASTYFCSCGGIGQTCCPAGNAAGAASCSQSGSTCESGVCSQRSSGGPGQQQITVVDTCQPTGSTEKDGIPTAIGCIPIKDVTALTTFVMKWLIGIGGGVAFLMILSAGFQIMTSSGDPKKLASGQEQITSAVAGLILIIFSIFMLRLIGVNILGLF